MMVVPVGQDDPATLMRAPKPRTVASMLLRALLDSRIK